MIRMQACRYHRSRCPVARQSPIDSAQSSGDDTELTVILSDLQHQEITSVHVIQFERTL